MSRQQERQTDINEKTRLPINMIATLILGAFGFATWMSAIQSEIHHVHDELDDLYREHEDVHDRWVDWFERVKLLNPDHVFPQYPRRPEKR